MKVGHPEYRRWRGGLAAQAQSELHNSLLRCCSRDAAKGGRAEAAVGLCEGWGVGEVEDFAAELGLRFTGQVDVFYQGDVEIAIGWAADGIARGVADGELRCRCEGIGVEEVRRRAVPW